MIWGTKRKARRIRPVAMGSKVATCALKYGIFRIYEINPL